MSKVIDFVLKLDRKHNEWMDGLEDWKVTIYMFVVLVLVLILWKYRPF